MKLFLFLILTSLLQLTFITSVMIVLEPNHKQFCLRKNFAEGAILKLSYVVSGENESLVKAVVSNDKDSEIFSKENENNGDFEQAVNNDSWYNLCFSIEVEAECIVSFDLVNKVEHSTITNLAKEDTFSIMNKNITDIENIFNELNQLSTRKVTLN